MVDNNKQMNRTLVVPLKEVQLVLRHAIAIVKYGTECTTERFTLCYNLCAESKYRRHTQHITDPLVFLELTTGAAVSLHMSARYRGWQNFAKYGHISILLICLLKSYGQNSFLTHLGNLII
ncbi:hypothetical protein THRCLA_20246 [Thraustotheca clavata]|uniref:Uncharacterized protein n=1 Tax=Thraustotheca clavata TaxID=74557 RepID=A0A1W0A9M6_9STRA|nr:hypothetical protein THRCLA_20246 [Thraustotheca clavata]